MPSRSTGRAFTLIELLVVIIIIAIVVSIVLPALGGARIAARGAGTQSLQKEILAAASQFENSERRAPGYFTVREMGARENADTRGMSEMENIMLDLAGGIVATAGANTVKAGPLAAKEIFVDPTLIGAQTTSNKAYFAPPAKYFVAQESGGGLNKQFGVSGHTAPEGQLQLPDIIDAFGQPLLAWRRDDTALREVTQLSDFARDDSGNENEVARFYWATNAAFLKSNSLGRLGKDQTDTASGSYSLLGGGVAAGDRVQSLAGALGSPAYPYRDPADPPTEVPTLPAAERGPMILQSAGADGFYFGSKDRGAKQFGPPLTTGIIHYSVSFVPPGQTLPGGAYKDKEGRDTTIDVLEKFDDMISTGGN